MAWWSKVWSLVTGSGGIVSAVDDVAKAVTAGEALAHDTNERTAGGNAVVAADLKSDNDGYRKALDAAVNTDDKSVRDSLKKGTF